MGSYFRDFHAPKATQQPTIGDTKFSVIRQDHMGWMNCDGRLLSTEDYPLLFRVVQYSFGGSNDQFALPDMRSCVPGAIGNGANSNVSAYIPSVSVRALGDAVGEETHTLIRNEMPSHTHGSTDVSGNTNGDGVTGDTDLTIAPTTVVTGVSANNDDRGIDAIGTSVTTGISVTTANTSISPDPHNHTIGRTGGDQPHNNMQPTVFIGNMFIYSGKIHGATSKWRYEINTNIL
jgi:microcystin-dependent protein